LCAGAFRRTSIRGGDGQAEQPDVRNSNLSLGEDGVRAENLPLIVLLQFAYNLNGGSKDQLVGAPSWVLSVPFDINAKEDEETATRIRRLSSGERDAALRQMLQALLAARFQLKVHHETRELPVLALTVAKGGSKLVPAAQPPGSSAPRGPDGWTGLHNPSRGRTIGHSATMKMLVDALSTKPEIGGRLVLDDTGLKDEYNFDLKWTPGNGSARAEEADAGGPSLFAALQEQLGLRLESTRAHVDCIVIDHVEQPSPN
jgi:uncharacterized protein (TIGR03435 family)